MWECIEFLTQKKKWGECQVQVSSMGKKISFGIDSKARNRKTITFKKHLKNKNTTIDKDTFMRLKN